MNKEEYIFPTDCSKENIRYLLDIGCRVVVTIVYRRFWKFESHINTCVKSHINRCELKYSGDLDFVDTEILNMSPTTPEYFWNNYEFALYINRNDLL